MDHSSNQRVELVAFDLSCIELVALYNLKESDYTDELPKEMLDRIKNVKETNDEEPDPEK